MTRALLVAALALLGCHKAAATAAPGKSAFTPPVPARKLHAAALLRDGRVLLVGGQQCSGGQFAGGPVADAFLFDPQDSTWTRVSPMGSARLRPAAIALPGGRALVIGGAGSAPDEEYDVARDTWRPVAAARRGRNDVPQLIALPGGGALSIGVSAVGAAFAQVYDPVAGGWNDVAPPPQAFAGASALAVLTDGRVLVSGGARQDGSAGAEAALFDPRRLDWAPAAAMQRARLGPVATALADGRVLVAQGELGDAAHATEWTSELYDPAADAWSSLVSIPARQLGGSTLTPFGAGGALLLGGLLAAGQSESPGALASYFDPQSGWLKWNPLAAGRDGHTATLLGDAVLLLGGDDPVSPSAPAACDPAAAAEVYSR